jgi:hypothetical protein
LEIERSSLGACHSSDASSSEPREIAPLEWRAPSERIEVVPATLAHVEAMNLRDGDRREIEALGVTPHDGLMRSLARSVWADAYLAGGEVAALVGLAVQPLVGGVAMPWLLTGRPVDRHRKAFLRLTRARTREMLAEHGLLVAEVHAEYREAVRWLGWLGFTLAPPRPLGPLGAPFQQATMRATP